MNEVCCLPYDLEAAQVEMDAAWSDVVRVYYKKYHKRRVRILRGKYEGRTGVLEGVTYVEGRDLRFCVMVLRKWNNEEYLNTDGESRSFRSWDEFKLID